MNWKKKKTDPDGAIVAGEIGDKNFKKTEFKTLEKLRHNF